eukprot:TRINITY_DN52521_c0_g1_i1.p1 TRINITY_DN52521_c0_g1~~TRINITY_DN52521_c0_g1_i1.p1  ORF type:complete len:155 (+),score=34.75 TRINITY_DN52521_c0_g1_i1:43-465(+)
MASHAGAQAEGQRSFIPKLVSDWRAVNKDAKLQTDCKVPLSIERTLLRWLRSAVLLSSLSAFLISTRDAASVVNGLLMALLSLVFVLVPLGKFVRRSLDLSKAVAVQPMTDRGLVKAMGISLASILGGILVVNVIFGTTN